MSNQSMHHIVTAPGNEHFASLITEFDIDLFRAGHHYRLYEKLGAHIIDVNGTQGVYFAVWAPGAKAVSLTGNFNGWNRTSHPMNVRWDGSGIWELYVPGLQQGEYYKYFVENHSGYCAEKGDPFAAHWETPPATASVVWQLQHNWQDTRWQKQQQETKWQNKPLSIYEVHLGSWMRHADGTYLSYTELAQRLPAYCTDKGFTHVELLPVMEHPFYGSWGYQVTGYFAPSSRFGTPQDFMQLIDALHNAGIGVILDWVPSHFPDDEHGLNYFDGSHLYEHEDPRKGYHQDWKSYIFNYGRNEVRSFLISNALFWLDKYHADGLRVDAVASMLYLDYSRRHGEWVPNEFGGRENLDAVSFLKELNTAVHTYHPNALTIAEESTAWPGVTHAVEQGGLGFDLKWMMGWMHDTLRYFSLDPIYRSYNQNSLTFNIYYAWSERFLLPLSHDEVVHGKYSLLEKMPGDTWQKFANLRLLYGYMFGHPGAKLLFMGDEFGQKHEWRHDNALDWDEASREPNKGVTMLLTDLNRLYTSQPSLHENNFSPAGFEWIDFNDTGNSVISWIRKSADKELIFVCNFTPMVRPNYRIGVPRQGYYGEVLNSDAVRYGGSGVHNPEKMESAPIGRHGRPHSLSLALPPLATLVLEWTGGSI